MRFDADRSRAGIRVGRAVSSATVGLLAHRRAVQLCTSRRPAPTSAASRCAPSSPTSSADGPGQRQSPWPSSSPAVARRSPRRTSRATRPAGRSRGTLKLPVGRHQGAGLLGQRHPRDHALRPLGAQPAGRRSPRTARSRAPSLRRAASSPSRPRQVRRQLRPGPRQRPGGSPDVAPSQRGASRAGGRRSRRSPRRRAGGRARAAVDPAGARRRSATTPTSRAGIRTSGRQRQPGRRGAVRRRHGDGWRRRAGQRRGHPADRPQPDDRHLQYWDALVAITANRRTRTSQFPYQLIKKPIGTSFNGRPYNFYVARHAPSTSPTSTPGGDAEFWRGVRAGADPRGVGLDAAGTRPASRGSRPPRTAASPPPASRSPASSTSCSRGPTARTRAGCRSWTVHDARPQPGRPRRRHAHDGVGLRPQPRLRHAEPEGERLVRAADEPVPGRLLHRRPPDAERVFLPAQRGPRPPRDQQVLARLHPGRSARRCRTRSTPSRPLPNYSQYDLFTPEYGDTVPVADDGRGRHDVREGHADLRKQVYDHYLAIDTTINVTAEDKTASPPAGSSSGGRRSSRARTASCRRTRWSARCTTHRAAAPGQHLRLLLQARPARG